jgi:hypothetical protein
VIVQCVFVFKMFRLMIMTTLETISPIFKIACDDKLSHLENASTYIQKNNFVNHIVTLFPQAILNIESKFYIVRHAVW